MTHYEVVNLLLTIGAVAGQLFVIVVALLYIFKKDAIVVKTVGKHGILLAFIVALAATLGSLYYSEITQFEPCKYCWLQRIFMYPQVILLGIALIKKSKEIIPYSMVLVGIGSLLALRHYWIQMVQSTTGIDNCELAGGVSCSKAYFLHLGYITIAMLSLTAFILVMILLYLARHYSKEYDTQRLPLQ